MPLHSKEQLKDGIVALWEITESFDELRKQVPEAWLEGINLLKLSKHNLAARALANTVCPGFQLLEKDEFGKPYFESADYQISISHAGKYAAFMLHRNEECGIDMEKITNRIIPITRKFIREDERQYEKLGLKGMFMVWCAKEAMYKLYGRKALDFKAHLKLDFSEIEESGELRGEINKGDYQKEVVLHYKFVEDYLMVHTL